MTQGCGGFYLRDAGRDNWVETLNTISQVFMGTRLSFAQCHDHPFDNWKQNDYHHFLAFLEARTTAGKATERDRLNRLKKGRGLPEDVREVLKPLVAALEAEKDPKELARKQKDIKSNAIEAVRTALGEEKAALVKPFLDNLGLSGVEELAQGEYRMPPDGVPNRR